MIAPANPVHAGRLARLAPSAFAAGVGLFAVLLAYCQAHALIEGVPAPLDLSVRWAAALALCWTAGSALLWLMRARLFVALRGSWPARLTAFAAIAGTMLTADAAAWLLWTSSQDPAALGGRLFDFAPVAGGLGVLMAVILRRTGATPVPAPSSSAWLALPEAPGLRIPRRELRVIRSAGNYCELDAGGRRHLVRASLSRIHGRLVADGFVRIHRTAVVNIAWVRELRRDASGRLSAHLADGGQVPVGRCYRGALATALAAGPPA